MMGKYLFCGSTEGYYMIEEVRRKLFFTFDDEPNGASESVNIFRRSMMYCRSCDRGLLKEKN